MQGKESPVKGAEIEVYAGIDVCKAWLDVHIHPAGQDFQVENTAKGFKRLGKRLATAKVTNVVMEATGKYHRDAHKALDAKGFAVAVVNPLRARLFAEAEGTLAKTDRLDARSLALMGVKLKPGAMPPLSEKLELLQELMRSRQSLVDTTTAFRNQLGETKAEFVRKLIERQITQLETERARLEAEIKAQIADDPALARRNEIALSIPGVGPVTAWWLIVGLPELGSCNAKQAAMMAGLAPLACESGKNKGQRKIRSGRADVRRGIYMAALSATRCNPPLRAFYQRLTSAAKGHQLVLTAVMRKLVVLANTLLCQDRLWLPKPPENA
jgi:transposase